LVEDPDFRYEIDPYENANAKEMMLQARGYDPANLGEEMNRTINSIEQGYLASTPTEVRMTIGDEQLLNDAYAAGVLFTAEPMAAEDYKRNLREFRDQYNDPSFRYGYTDADHKSLIDARRNTWRAEDASRVGVQALDPSGRTLGEAQQQEAAAIDQIRSNAYENLSGNTLRQDAMFDTQELRALQQRQYEQDQAEARRQATLTDDYIANQGLMGMHDARLATGASNRTMQAALANYRPELTSQLIDQRFGQLGQISALGQASAAGQGAAGQNFASNVSSLYGQQGAARAGEDLARAKAYGGMINGVVSGITSMGTGGF